MAHTLHHLWRGLRLLLLIVFMIVRWPLAAIVMFLLAGLALALPEALLPQLAAGSTLREALELALRALLVLPLTGIGVLLLHPVRGPLMLLNLPLRLARRLRPRRAPAVAAPPALPAEPGEGSSSAPSALVVAPVPPPTQRLYRPLSRRRFLIEGAALGAIMVDAALLEPNWVQFTEVDIPVRNLPERFHGFTIAQLSDLHVSVYTSPEDIARLIPRVNALGTDMIVVTGDFVDRDAAYAAPTAEVLSGLSAPEGVYTILGNHDHWSGAEIVAAELRRRDLGFLRNSNTVLRRGADKLYLLGSDDPSNSPRWGGSHTDLPRTLQGTGTDAPRLLLIHNPVIMPQVRDLGIEVSLLGHTHGGQFRIPYLTDTLVKNVEYIDQGLYTFGQSQFYVNRGIGTVGPPVRFRSRPEVTRIRLVPANA
jgi:predicted MPP superfamily phosphohydrolase